MQILLVSDVLKTVLVQLGIVVGLDQHLLQELLVLEQALELLQQLTVVSQLVRLQLLEYLQPPHHLQLLLGLFLRLLDLLLGLELVHL